jgi:AcrR family transcriptional regulator
MEHSPRRARKRIDILKSAAAAFQRRGYHGASVEQIASALNMTKGNLYYYFKNKEEILYVCHEHALDIILRHLNDVEKSDLPADRKLRSLIGGFVHLFIDEMQGTSWTLELEALTPPLLKKTIARRDRVERGFRRILREGMADGLFAPGDPKLLTFAILGVINWIPRWYNPAGKATSDEIAEVFADYLVNGLLARDTRRSESDVAVDDRCPIQSFDTR